MGDDIQWTAVISGNLSAVAVHNKSLFVRFHNGSVYRYETNGDSEKLYHGLLEAGSPGGYLAHHVKGKYVYEKIA